MDHGSRSNPVASFSRAAALRARLRPVAEDVETRWRNGSRDPETPSIAANQRVPIPISAHFPHSDDTSLVTPKPTGDEMKRVIQCIQESFLVAADFLSSV